MSAALMATIARHARLASPPRTAATTNAPATKALAVPTVNAPEAKGRSGWFTASVSRSDRSFNAFPAAVNAAAAPAAKRSGRANSPHASGPTATIPPIPTPTADIAQFTGRARRRSPPMSGRRRPGPTITVTCAASEPRGRSLSSRCGVFAWRNPRLAEARETLAGGTGGMPWPVAITRDYHGGTMTTLLLHGSHVYRNPPATCGDSSRHTATERTVGGEDNERDASVRDRISEGDEGSTRGGGNRPLRGTRHGPQAHAGGPEACGGGAPNREGPLHFAGLCEGAASGAQGGVARDHPRRALQRIREGGEGPALPHRGDAASRTQHGASRGDDRTRGGEDPRRDLGERRVRPELPRGPRDPRANGTGGSHAAGQGGARLERDLPRGTLDRSPCRDEGAGRRAGLRARGGLGTRGKSPRRDEGARPRERGGRHPHRAGNRAEGDPPPEPVRRGDAVARRHGIAVPRHAGRGRPHGARRVPGEDGAGHAREGDHRAGRIDGEAPGRRDEDPGGIVRDRAHGPCGRGDPVC